MNMRFGVIDPEAEMHGDSPGLPTRARTTERLGDNRRIMFSHVLGTIRANLKPIASRTIPPRLVYEQERFQGMTPVSRLSRGGRPW